MNRLDKTLLITVLLLGGILWLQHRWTIRLTEERDRFPSDVSEQEKVGRFAQCNA